MTRIIHTLSGLLLATTALAAPHVALAQVAETEQPEVTSVEEIVVLGRYIPEPMRATSEISAFVTAEDLERTGDSNAADALVRVAGLTVAENRFVYVRGLGERYSAARLNGSPLPSPEPLQRVVPLDLFPASILRSVAVQKTYSPNYPGEFGGGIIDLYTVATPDVPFFNFGVSMGGNTETTLQDGLIYYGSRSDFTGFDDGTRDLPGRLRAAMATGNRVVQGANFTAEEIQRIGWDFVNAPLNLLQMEDNIQPDFGFDVSAGRSFDMDSGARFGVIGVLGYSNEWRTQNGVQGEGRVDVDTLSATRQYDFMSTDNNIGWDGLLGLSFETADHLIQWTNLYVRRTTKETRSREASTSTRRATIWFAMTTPPGTCAPCTPSWPVSTPSGDLGVNWRGAWARSTRDAPYEKTIRYSIGDDGVAFHEGQRNSTSFSELTDDVVSGGIDLSYDVALSNLRDMTFTVGAETYENTREAEQRIFSFQGSGLSPEFQRQRVDFFFADFNQGPGLIRLVETTGGGGAAAYDAELTVNAAYAQVEADILPLVSGSVGVRYEEAEQTVVSRDLFGGVTPFQPTVLENEYWLPAATLTWNFAEDMQFRFGASQTIGRPQFRELAPQQYLDPDSDRLFIGNPFLTDSELLNLDLRYEWYFQRDQYVTAGLFYKDIDRPVESVINDTGSVTQQTYLNAPGAELWGIELDVKKYFDSPMTGAFWDGKRWLVQANYTYVQSELRVGADDEVFPLSGNGTSQPATNFFTDGARLQGQSEHLANLQFGWEDDIVGSQATILVNYASERSSARGRPGEPDLIQEPGVMLDFVYRRDFGAFGRDFSFGLELRNLLNTEFQEYQELGQRVDINRYDLGASGSISLSTSF
ncbi:LOW QUALITY PROTEIN: tonB-dependent receptor [Brevundimonas abyssalis TAR-001]|uniref:TonB-dependent receptor n=2 Tax=Brevundimonas TaxID=41275 RepID=A0A8E0KIZ9_9CAUL|nr:LOW QUALITY PROTEIN: tonB-dependent receptor [Brevundimonas abyssalis TAR-001]